jgi:hypothetical protein
MNQLGFYHPPSEASNARLTQGMNKMRNFILCSAAVLCGWLTLSYRYHPNADTAGKPSSPADQTGAASLDSKGPAKQVNAGTPKDRLATMSAVKGQ